MAKKLQFSTVPEELLHVAIGAVTYLKMHGFRVSLEANLVEYPRTPTLVAKRRHSTLLIEVARKLDRDVVSEWVAYGSSCDSDVQFAIALPNNPGVSQSDMEFCKRQKVGVYTFDDPGEGTELLTPVDLALNLAPPKLETLPATVRPVVAPFYEKIQHGDWRDGLADAYLALEQTSRKYLKSRISKPGISVLDKNGKPIKLTAKKIDDSTLGQLGVYFLGITTPNVLDSLLAQTLPTINRPGRVGVTHKRHSAVTEKKLRQIMGRQIYAIIKCLKELLTK